RLSVDTRSWPFARSPSCSLVDNQESGVRRNGASSTTLPHAALRVRMSSHIGYSLKDHFDDQLWCSNQGCVIDLFRSSLRTHPSRQEQLGSRIDHPIFLSDQIPRGLCLPRRLRRLFLNARESNGTLCCGEESGLLEGGVLTKGSAKSLIGQPDQTVPVRSELR